MKILNTWFMFANREDKNEFIDTLEYYLKISPKEEWFNAECLKIELSQTSPDLKDCNVRYRTVYSERYMEKPKTYKSGDLCRWCKDHLVIKTSLNMRDFRINSLPSHPGNFLIMDDPIKMPHTEAIKRAPPEASIYPSLGGDTLDYLRQDSLNLLKFIKIGGRGTGKISSMYGMFGTDKNQQNKESIMNEKEKNYLVLEYYKEKSLEIRKEANLANEAIILNSEVGKATQALIKAVKKSNPLYPATIENSITRSWLSLEDQQKLATVEELSNIKIKELQKLCDTISNLILQTDTFAERLALLKEYKILKPVEQE